MKPEMPQFDEHGFLCDPAVWNDDLAEQLAARDGLGELQGEHWQVLLALREYYEANKAPPPVGHICEENHMDVHCMQRLFGGQREAWRIAGLPFLGEESFTYLE